jgi:hypothetical protein
MVSAAHRLRRPSMTKRVPYPPAALLGVGGEGENLRRDSLSPPPSGHPQEHARRKLPRAAGRGLG